MRTVRCGMLPTPLHKAKLLNYYTRVAITGWIIGHALFVIGTILLGLFYQTEWWSIYLWTISMAGCFFVILNLIPVILTSYYILKTDWEDKDLNKIKKTYGALGLLVSPIACYLFIKCAIDRIKESDEQYKSIDLRSFGIL